MKKEKEEKIGKETLKLKSDKVRERNKKIRYVKLTLLVMALFLIIIYFLLKVCYWKFYCITRSEFCKKTRTNYV